MMSDKKVLRLYLIAATDPLSSDPLIRIMEAVENGVTMVQLREKGLSSRLFFQRAMDLKKRLSERNIPLIINDRLDIALAVESDGVHLGRHDIPVKKARALLGPDKIIGFSASTLQDALRGFHEGADYIGAGAVFPTETKNDARRLSLDDFEKISRGVPLPVVAIGGISPDKASLLFSRGAAGLAVSSAILKSADIASAVKMFRKQVRN